MGESLLILLLFGGVPYYVLLERGGKVNSAVVLLITVILFIIGIFVHDSIGFESSDLFSSIALSSGFYTMYRASKVTNFYKMGYYLIFINSPFFLFFSNHVVCYGVSLLLVLLGITLIARFYEKHYGSANYAYVTGTSLATPYLGTFLSIYLIAIALYPPFPNMLFLMNNLLHTTPSLLWYITVIFIFFANFSFAISVMKQTVFGKANSNIHYIDVNIAQRVMHLVIIGLLLLLSAFAFEEMLS